MKQPRQTFAFAKAASATPGRGQPADAAARHGGSGANGSTLMVVLLSVGILSVVSLASYLALVENQSRSILRSRAWNSSLPIAEAGVEDALAHVNATNVLACDGWTGSDPVCSRQQTLGSGYYSVTISNNAAAQVETITSTGYEFWQSGSYVGRTVQVVLQPPFFPNIALSAQNISFTGGFSADSYDSSNPLYSTATNYAGYDPAKATAQAVVSITPPGLNCVLGGAVQIYGYVNVPPGGTYTAKGGSSVGDAAWVNGGNAGVQPLHGLKTYTNTAPDVVVPAPLMTAPAPAGGNVGGTNYDYVLNGSYNSPTLDASGVNTIIYVQGQSTVYVPGNISVSTIVFAPGASLSLYVAEPTLSFSPTVVGAMPPQLTVLCAPTVTGMHMSAGNTFVGFLYAPEMTLKAEGSTLYGGATVGSLSCQGTFAVHYDMGRTNSSPGRLQITSWAEL